MLIFPYVYPDLEDDVFTKQQEYVVGVFLAVLFLKIIIAAIVMLVKTIKNRKKMPDREESKSTEPVDPTPEELRNKRINEEPKPDELKKEEEKEVSQTLR